MKVAVLAGGRTPERDVSLRSGHRVVGALDELGHDAFAVDPGEVPLAETLPEHTPDRATWRCTARKVRTARSSDCWTCSASPYTGTAAFDCEVAFDKVLAKDALDRAGVRTPAWVTIEDGPFETSELGAASTAVERVGLPCVVKPSRSGSPWAWDSSSARPTSLPR